MTTDSRQPDPRLHPPSPTLSRPQAVIAFAGLLVLVGVVALVVALSGKGGVSVHPSVAPASAQDTLVTSRAP